MAVIGVGVDLVRIGRFSRFLETGNTAILDRLFTVCEKEYCLGKRNPAPHLAARFGAKEAFFKATGFGLRQGMSWQDVEVERNALGRPSLRLRGKAAELCGERGVTSVQLSYSHDGDYAVATVILETT